jgi:hypothetical protein
MKVLAAFMALKATRKTIKLRFWRGFRRTLPTFLQSRSDDDQPT